MSDKLRRKVWSPSVAMSTPSTRTAPWQGSSAPERPHRWKPGQAGIFKAEKTPQLEWFDLSCL